MRSAVAQKVRCPIGRHKVSNIVELHSNFIDGRICHSGERHSLGFNYANLGLPFRGDGLRHTFGWHNKICLGGRFDPPLIKLYAKPSL